MSQRALEAALGKLICDDAFRQEFYEDAEGAVARAGFLLTPVELGSLYKIDLAAIEAFVPFVDDRVRRVEEHQRRRRPKPVQRSSGSRAW